MTMLIGLAVWFALVGLLLHIYGALYAWHSDTAREWRCGLLGHRFRYGRVHLDREQDIERERCTRCYQLRAVRVVPKQSAAR